MFRLVHDSVCWISKSDLTAEELLSGNVKRNKSDEAIDLIQEILEEGPCLASEIFMQAQKQGIGRKTLKNAKGLLPVSSRKTAEGWIWDLVQQ